jgi:hypothetical protein
MQWTGSIYEKVIDGENFVFIGMQIIILNKDSKISKVIKTMYNNEEFYQLCKLIKILYHSYQGFIDDSVKEYLT